MDLALVSSTTILIGALPAYAGQPLWSLLDEQSLHKYTSDVLSQSKSSGVTMSSCSLKRQSQILDQ